MRAFRGWQPSVFSIFCGNKAAFKDANLPLNHAVHAQGKAGTP